MTEIILKGGTYELCANGKAYGRIIPVEGATDTFIPLENGAWKWLRKTETPVDHMRMELVLFGEPTFTMVPAVSYNGNGWGNYPEYIGDRDEDGTPWIWASHRVTIPACTYSENENISIALMAKPNDNNACSLYQTEEGRLHAVIFPEEEKPRTLQRHFWGPAFQGTMEPKCEFEAILQLTPSDGTKFRYKSLMDFAWRFYGHKIDAPRKAEELQRLSIAYTRFLYQKERNGFAGFTTGTQWHTGVTAYRKQEHYYQVGWVGQSTSMANAILDNYIRYGQKYDLDMALEVQDKWLEFGQPKPGIIGNRLDYTERRFHRFEDMKVEDVDRWMYGDDNYESIINSIVMGTAKTVKRDETGARIWNYDACDHGTCADGYFETYEMLAKIGIKKPEYFDAALAACDFTMGLQYENGSFAVQWDKNGQVQKTKGTLGCFMCLPLIKAWQHTDNAKYLDSAVRAFWFYYKELEEQGFTTAGALDTYSIDKESASPLLRVCLRLYDATQEERYIAAAEKIGWYLCTWMMHFTVNYPEDCMISQLKYDTFGSTSVSTPHQALDQYALRDVISFRRLTELTGNKQWEERAKALWCNANQGISDGTLFINGKIRPAGSQDEAIFHTRWGRHHVPPFSASQWLPAWPCAFRLENLRWCDDWAFFDEGLQHIEGKIEQ